MKLYGSMLSPYVARVVLAAHAKGVELTPEYPPTTGAERQAHLAINPSGKIPFLDDDGFYLAESAVIADYLDMVLPGPPLWPDDPRARARAALLARYVDTPVAPALQGYLRAIRDRAEGPQSDQDRKTFVDGIGYIDHYRDADALWVSGDRFTHADAALIPWLYLIDRFPEANLASVVEALPGLARYWGRVKSDALTAPVLARIAAGADAMLGKGAGLASAPSRMGETLEAAPGDVPA